jgi:co-chaperonin GroES (HSP10)
MKKAQGLNVLVKQIPENRTTEMGLFIPESTAAKKVAYGEVFSVGPLVHDDGCVDVSIGTVIAFDVYSATEIGKGDDGLVEMRVPSTGIYFVQEGSSLDEMAATHKILGPQLLMDGKEISAKRKDW